MLGAIDDRLAAQAPIVMVSHSMQGGCLCENAPGLRVDYSNMEIAAAPAPRPQMLVAATGDWTRKTMTVEGPAIRGVYELLGAKDRFEFEIFDYEHNYNKTSREAVYGFFGKWLLKISDAGRLKELAYKKEADADLRVFPDGKFPEGELSEAELMASIVRRAREQIDRARPRDERSLAAWKSEWHPVWEHSLQLQHARADSILSEDAKEGETVVRVKRQPEGLEVNFTVLKPENGRARAVAVIATVGDEDREGARKLAEKLRGAGAAAIWITHEAAPEKRDQFANFYSTYNRTVIQDRAAELKVASQYARERFKDAPVFVAGRGSAGLAALAVAPLVSGVAADCNALDDSRDENLLELNVFFPGARRIASFQGIAALAAPNPLLLHNTGGKLSAGWLPALYSGSGRYRHMEERATDQIVADWIISSAGN
jgi:hypothetical protein